MAGSRSLGRRAALRRVALLLSACALAAAIALSVPCSASAYVHSFEPVTTDACWATACGAGGDAFASLLSGTADWGDTTSFESSLTKLETAAEVLPKYELVGALGTIALGADAFAVGWKIGTTINARWLHLAGIGLGTTAGAPASITGFNFIRRLNGGLNTFWPEDGWYLYLSFSGGSSYAVFKNCHAANVTNVSMCVSPYASLSQADAAYSFAQAFNGGTLKPVSHACPAYCTGTTTDYAIEISVADMQNKLVVDQGLQAFTGQTSGIQTGWAVHGGCGVLTTACAFNTGPSNPTPQEGAAQTTGDGFDDANRNRINCELDPADWACPEPAAGGSGYSSSGGWRGSDGGVITGPNEYNCKFDDGLGGRDLWNMLREGNEAAYDEACEEAWNALKAAEKIDADGYPSPTARFNPRKIMRGDSLGNQDLKDTLSNNGPLDEWWKVGSYDVETTNGPAEAHWYQKLTSGDLYLTEDYFVIFKELF